jgi:hypothetical protein
MIYTWEKKLTPRISMPWQSIEENLTLYKGYSSPPSMDLELYLGYIMFCWVSFVGQALYRG